MGDEAKMTHALWAAAETARWEKQMPDTPTSITQFWMDRIIAEKQAEAVTAALDALAAQVEGELPVFSLPTGDYVDRDAVLALIAEARR